jgi:gliding motility-associated lipoprotein GldH
MRKDSLKIIVSVFFIATCLLFSCGKDTVYNEYQPVNNKTWNRQDVYFFNFQIKDASIAYNVSLQLRNNDQYPYQNLWIFKEETQPSGVSVKDTIEYMLADDFGKWTGNGITLYQSRINLRNNYHFPDTGKYTISVMHGMRDDNLKGIENVGLLIEKSK